MKMRKSLLFFTALLITACGVNTPNTDKKVKALTISGKVEFPDLLKGMSLKATSLEVAQDASISVIYPHTGANADKTVATGLTTSTGEFTILPNTGFDPKVGDIFVLEAFREAGAYEKNPKNKRVLSIRTFIRWNGVGWNSITFPDLYINSKTTAITIVTDSLRSTINPDQTINTVNTSTDTNQIGNIGNISSQKFIEGAKIITDLLTAGKDPVANVKFSSNDYVVDRTDEISTLVGTFWCESCDFRGGNLDDINFSYRNFPSANLGGLDLTKKVLNDTNLFNVKLIGSIINGMNFSVIYQHNLNTSDLSNVYAENTNFSATKMIGVTASYGYFKGANFSNSDVSAANFSNSDMRNIVTSGTTTSDSIGFPITIQSFRVMGTNNPAIFRNVDFRGATFTSTSFAYCDMSNSDFSTSTMSNVSFNNTNLSNTILTGLNLTNINFDSANLTSSNLTGSTLTGSTLTNTNLTNANLTGNNLTGLNLTGANLTGANLTNVNLTSTVLTGTTLTGATLTGATLTGQNLNNISLIGANLSGVNLIGISLAGKDLTSSNLSNQDLSKFNLKGTIFVSSNLSNVTLSGNNLNGENLSKSNLTGAKLISSNLNKINLSGANLSKADITGCNLNKANLRGANLTNAILNRDNLNKITFVGADLTGAKWIDGRICGAGSIGVCK